MSRTMIPPMSARTVPTVLERTPGLLGVVGGVGIVARGLFDVVVGRLLPQEACILPGPVVFDLVASGR